MKKLNASTPGSPVPIVDVGQLVSVHSGDPGIGFILGSKTKLKRLEGVAVDVDPWIPSI